MPHAVISYKDRTTEHQPTNTAINLVHNPSNPSFFQEEEFLLTPDCSIAQDQSSFPSTANQQAQYPHQTLVPSQDTNTNAHHHNQTSLSTYNQMATTTLYYGCHHQPDLATSLTGLSLGGNLQVDTTSCPGFSVIMNPRWCPRCLSTREGKIRDNYENRRIFPPSADKSKARKEREYNEYRRGVIEGRIQGLSRPLYNGTTTGLSNGNENANGNGHGQPEGRGVVDDRLIAMLSTQSLAHFDEGWSHEQMEMEEYFQEHRCFRKGIREGRKLQVKLERAALRIAEAWKREELLENALM